MTSDKPNVKAESRYSISKTCELLGIHRNTLRRWTDEGKIKRGYNLWEVDKELLTELLA